MLQIYNTLSKKKEIFKPIHSGKIDFYVCGMTVYDHCHIGHARLFLAFDTIIRYLRYSGFEVNYIRNITDIDDKIINRAHENNETVPSLTDRMIEAMHEDFEKLNLIPPTLEPRATEYIEEMKELIQTLIDKGYAYVSENGNGDVYYQVEKFDNYGCLSHLDIADLQAGSRIEVNTAKRNPLDFVLWKAAKQGEPSWDSPWGAGRPGWHIECSAMSLKNLGETFDIHGGGPDLRFPHHENELAQSEAATGKTFVNYWMHVGALQIDKQKMSKSLGNIANIKDFLEDYHPEVLRYFSISSHYRSPVDFSSDQIALSFQALERFYRALRGLEIDKTKIPLKTAYEKEFQEAMSDDFNTPVAMAVLFELAREINRLRSEEIDKASALAGLLVKLGNVLGLLYEDPEVFLQPIKMEGVEELIIERNIARKNKNWAEADRIRDKLLSRGISIEDTSTGTTWSSINP